MFLLLIFLESCDEASHQLFLILENTSLKVTGVFSLIQNSYYVLLRVLYFHIKSYFSVLLI